MVQTAPWVVGRNQGPDADGSWIDESEWYTHPGNIILGRLFAEVHLEVGYHSFLERSEICLGPLIDG